MPIHALGDCVSAKLVIEAIVEDLEAKRELLARSRGCRRAGQRSSPRTRRRCRSRRWPRGSKHPRRVAGLHFFNPPPLMPLVEIVSGLATDPEVAATLYSTAAGWGKTPVHAKSTPGFIVNRCARPFYAEALRLLNERAADPATIDAVMREAGGFRMGPFELLDLIGNDVSVAVTTSVWRGVLARPAVHAVRAAAGDGRRRLISAARAGAASTNTAGSDRSPSPSHRTRAAGAGARRRATAISARRRRWSNACSQPACRSSARRASRSIPDRRDRRRRRVARAERRPHGDRARRRVRCARPGAVRSCARFCDVHAAGGGPRRHLLRRRATPRRSARCRRPASPSRGSTTSAGLAVLRTVAMLANEAADAAKQGDRVAARHRRRRCMKGVNYPRGPLAWADAIGVARRARRARESCRALRRGPLSRFAAAHAPRGVGRPAGRLTLRWASIIRR